jgi:hypothetical protein
MNPKNFANSMFGESKSTCVSCGTTWYTKHFKNGFCHDCQTNGAMQKAIDKIKFKRFLSKLFTAVFYVIVVIFAIILLT